MHNDATHVQVNDVDHAVMPITRASAFYCTLSVAAVSCCSCCRLWRDTL